MSVIDEVQQSLPRGVAHWILLSGG
jgi:hypothetical protein